MQEVALVNCCLPPRDLRQLAPPQGLLSIAPFIEKAGYLPKLVNLASIIPSSLYCSEQVFAALTDQNASILALSVWDSVLPTVIHATRLLKKVKPDISIILGGPSASTVGQKLITVFPWVDGVVTGEGETGLPLVVQFLDSDKNKPEELPHGCFVRSKGKVIAGERARFRLEADEIPSPDYSILSGSTYGRAEISTSRGCLYNCRFCSVNSVWGREVSIKPLEKIYNELTGLWHNPDISSKVVHILDDTFLNSWKRAEAFSNWHRDNRNDHSFTCYARLDELDEVRVERLAESGCYGVYVGLESPRLKGSKVVTVEQVLNKVKNTAARMSVIASLIWGDPAETRDDLEQTLNMVENLLRLSESVAVNLYQLAPLSGTFYAEKHRADLFSPELTSEFVYPGYLPDIRHDPEVVELIHSHPDIFPAFYHVKTSDFESKREYVYKTVSDISVRL